MTAKGFLPDCRGLNGNQGCRHARGIGRGGGGGGGGLRCGTVGDRSFITGRGGGVVYLQKLLGDDKVLAMLR